MTTSQAAAAFDISIPVLQRAIRKSGLRMRLTKRGTDYLFSPDDLDAVSEYRHKPKSAKTPGHSDTPGLPLEWLSDPAHTAEFVIAAYIGHNDPALTMRLYAHSQDDALRAAANSLQH